MKPDLLSALAVCACACKSTPQPVPAAPAAGPSEPERILHEYTSAFNRGALDEVLAMLTEDVVVIGVDHCRGAPCFGRQGARDGYLELTLKNGFQRTNAWWKVEGDRVTAHWETHPGNRWPRGAEHVRGIMTFTIRDGKIARVENTFRIDDPETVVIRHMIGDVTFGLRAPDTDALAARVLVGNQGTTSSVALQLVEPVPAGQPRATLRDGTCAKPGVSARELRFVPGTLETRVDVTVDQLLSAPFHVELRRSDGTRAACGNLPSPPPTK